MMTILKKTLARLHQLEELSLSLVYIGLALVAFVQVFCRYVLDVSFTWFEEGGRYIGVFVTFLGASIGVRYGAHFSMDLIVSHLKPKPARALGFLVNLLGGAVMATVAYYGGVLTFREFGYETTSPAMGVPMYLAYLPIPFFSALMAARLVVIAVTGTATPEGAAAADREDDGEGAP